MCWEVEIQVHFFAYVYPIVLGSFVEKWPSFALPLSLCLLSVSCPRGGRGGVVFRACLVCSFNYFVYLYTLVPCCFDYCSFMILPCVCVCVCVCVDYIYHDNSSLNTLAWKFFCFVFKDLFLYLRKRESTCRSRGRGRESEKPQADSTECGAQHEVQSQDTEIMTRAKIKSQMMLN